MRCIDEDITRAWCFPVAVVLGLTLSHPYSCQSCSKSYKYSHSLSRHLRYECGKEATFECFVVGCPYKSKRKDNLNAHIRTLHLRELSVKLHSKEEQVYWPYD
ncbi:hypothetical protein WA026_020857 [Henosepilachna vigintioctopunctata]|uniref:C2H2-type domain-containing protein n=1 Tax=Henosepilachna vigintioctopunctata TaxID=420089 RepID=A0AAW1UNL2_9CUCU